MGWTSGLMLAAALLAAGCGSTVAIGHRIIVDVQAAADLNPKDGVPQPAQFHVLAMKSQPRDLAQQAEGRLASLGTLMGDGGVWVWPSQAVSLGPVDVREKEEFAFVGIRVTYNDKAKALVVPLDGRERDGYALRDGEHRVTFRLGKDTVTQGKGAAPK